MTFVGTEGEIFVNRGKLDSKPGDIIEEPIGDNEIHLYQSPGGSHGGHRQDWVNSIKSRKTPAARSRSAPARSPSATWATSPICTARSSASSRSSGIPQKWEFVGNDAANKFRDYPYPRRAGFELPKV